jgi:hypothetical protein
VQVIVFDETAVGLISVPFEVTFTVTMVEVEGQTVFVIKQLYVPGALAVATLPLVAPTSPGPDQLYELTGAMFVFAVRVTEVVLQPNVPLTTALDVNVDDVELIGQDA